MLVKICNHSSLKGSAFVNSAPQISAPNWTRERWWLLRAAVHLSEEAQTKKPPLLPQPNSRRQVLKRQHTLSKRIEKTGMARRGLIGLSLLHEAAAEGLPISARLLNTALTALARSGELREAVQLLKQMPSFGAQPNTFSYNAAISACSHARKWRAALNLLDDMKAANVAPDTVTYNTVIDACSKCGNSALALKLIAEMKAEKLHPDIYTYSSAITALARRGQHASALQLFDDMQLEGITPNVVAYTAVLDSYDKSGQWQAAIDTIAEMKAANLKPNILSYTSVINACARAGETNHALQILEETLQSGEQCDVTLFTAVMSSLTDSSQALRLMTAMHDTGVVADERAYNAAINVAAQCRDGTTAQQLLGSMRQNGLTPTLVTYNTVMNALGCSGAWQNAVHILEVDIPNEGLIPDAISYTTAITACASPTGNWERAYQLLDSMIAAEHPPQKAAYDVVMQACGRSGEWCLALTVLQDMIAEQLQPDVQSYNIAINACARSGQLEPAIALYGDMIRSNLQADHYTCAALMLACARSSDWQQAVTLFDELRYIKKVRPGVLAYSSLMSVLTNAKEWAKAALYYDRMFKDGYVADASINNLAVLAAVRDQADPIRVLKLVQAMLDKQQAPSAAVAYDALCYVYKQVTAVELVALLLRMNELGTELTAKACNVCIRALTSEMYRANRDVYSDAVSYIDMRPFHSAVLSLKLMMSVNSIAFTGSMYELLLYTLAEQCKWPVLLQIFDDMIHEEVAISRGALITLYDQCRNTAQPCREVLLLMAAIETAIQ